MINLEEVKKQFLSQYIMSSPKTQVKYKNEINLFLSVCEIDSIEKLNAFNDVNISKFYEYAKANNWSDCTLNQRLTINKIFTKFCVKKHYIDNNFLEDIKLRKVSNTIHFTPSNEDCEKLLIYIKEHTSKKRLYLMVKLLLNSGLRRTEICSLKTGDIDIQLNCLRIKGKGNKTINQPITEELINELVDYIRNERQEIIDAYKKIGGKDLNYLFLSFVGGKANSTNKNLNNGNQIDNNAFYQQIKRYAKLAGIENAEKFSTHCLRRKFVTSIYEQTGDILIAQKSARHASSSTTTQCYIDFDGERLRDAVNKISGKTKDKQEYEEYLKLKEKFES